MRIRDFVVVGAVAGLAGLGYGQVSSAGAAGDVAVSASQPTPAKPPMPDTGDRPLAGLWPGDADGDGVISDAGAERIPHFIAAVTDDGELGYVRNEELNYPGPATPEEAQRETELLKTQGPRSIPVFADDLTTEIGRFTFGRGGGHEVYGGVK